MQFFKSLTKLAVVLLFAALAPAALVGDTITTSFTTNNGFASNTFDINVLASDGIVITNLEVNLDPGDWDVSLFTRDGSYVGNESSAAGWTEVDTITGLTSAGTDNPTAWDISDLVLGSGPQAFHIATTNGNGLNYYNGGLVGSLEAADANVEIFEGVGGGGLFSGATFSPRVWSGTIEYELVVIPEPSSFALPLVAGCVASIRRRKA